MQLRLHLPVYCNLYDLIRKQVKHAFGFAFFGSDCRLVTSLVKLCRI